MSKTAGKTTEIVTYSHLFATDQNKKLNQNQHLSDTEVFLQITVRFDLTLTAFYFEHNLNYVIT